MKIWKPLEICALIVLVVLGVLLIQGRDSTLIVTFCSIGGGIFTRYLGIEIRQKVKKNKDTRNGPSEPS